MTLSAVWAVSAVVLVPPLPLPSAVTPDPRVEALLAGMEAYERATEALVWEQEVYTCPSENWGLTKWGPLEHSSRACDGWRWWHKSLFTYIDEPNATPYTKDARYAGDASMRITYGTEGERTGGMLTNADEFFHGGCGIWQAMGRALDVATPVRWARPSEALRRGKRLVYLEPDADMPWPGICAEEASNRLWLDIELRVDPEHGFAPRAARVYARRNHDNPRRAEASATITLAYTRVGDVFLPASG